jgi:hypothetical protein
MRCRLLAEALHPAPLPRPALEGIEFRRLGNAGVGGTGPSRKSMPGRKIPQALRRHMANLSSELQARVRDFLAEQCAQKTTRTRRW